MMTRYPLRMWDRILTAALILLCLQSFAQANQSAGGSAIGKAQKLSAHLIEEQKAKSESLPIPEEWKSCSSDMDCIPALVECWSWSAVNRKLVSPYTGPLSGALLPLPYSLACKDKDIVDPGAKPKVFCKAGKCEKVMDPQAFSPSPERLFFAIGYRKTNEALSLIDKGVDPNSLDKNGETPLSAALRSAAPSSEILKLAKSLIRHGASLSWRDTEGNTPLMLVNHVYSGADELITLFLKNGADPNAKNKSGKTVAELFVHDKKIYKILLDAGAKDIRDACSRMVDSCKDAGFTQARSGPIGTRTFQDCYEPLLVGKKPPSKVKISDAILSECREIEAAEGH